MRWHLTSCSVCEHLPYCYRVQRELASAQNHMLLAVTELKQGKEQMNRFMEEKRVLSEHATDAEALLEKMAAHSKQVR